MTQVPPPPNRSATSFNPSVSARSPSRTNGSFVSYDDQASLTGPSHVYRSNRSTAPTLATNAETIYSDTVASTRGGTSARGPHSLRDGRANSTFSSPQHSQESLATTLTTIQSSGDATPGLGPLQVPAGYPAPPPASAIPGHLIPRTYQTATANNLLTDNASILTLASSTKRRRRSMDTDASVRAIAPTSMYGNSRESLPLSILSANMDPSSSFLPARPAFANAERASVYSSSGVPPLSERNSYYASKAIDGASVRSGRLGHGRAESITGSIAGVPAGPLSTMSPLASPRDVPGPRRSSRMSTDIREHTEAAHAEDEQREASDDEDDPAEPSTPEATQVHRDTGKTKALD